MNIDITKLKNSIVKDVSVDLEYQFNEDDLKQANILSMDKVLINGVISKTSFDDYSVNLNVSGEMFLPCAITLKPVSYPFNINIDEIFTQDNEDISKIYKKSENTIDILPIVWENILMEIPMKVVSPDARLEKVEGNGWKLVTEEESNINPELAKLKDLL